MEQKKHFVWLDIAKGIAIISTIIGHCVAKNKLGVFIFSFHMPLFFILSGYTIRQIPMNEIAKSTKKDFLRLYIPVFAVSGIRLALHFAKSLAIHRNESWISEIAAKLLSILWGNCNDFHGINGIGYMWFVVTLFWSKLFFRIMLEKINSYRELFLLFGTVLCSIPALRAQFPQGFDLIFVSMLFMDFGFLLKNQFQAIGTSKKIGVAAFFLWIFIVQERKSYIDLAQRIYPMIALFSAVCGSFCVIQLSSLLEQFRIAEKPLSFLGKHSLTLLCIHSLDSLFSRFWQIDPFQKSFLNTALHIILRLSLDIFILVLCEMTAKLSQKLRRVK